MRHNLKIGNSTKAERVFHEVLKEMKVPFRHRWIIEGMEVDFLIGKYAIEIDGHGQNEEKNRILALAGYIPLHILNSDLTKGNAKIIINKII